MVKTEHCLSRKILFHSSHYNSTKSPTTASTLSAQDMPFSQRTAPEQTNQPIDEEETGCFPGSRRKLREEVPSVDNPLPMANTHGLGIMGGGEECSWEGWAEAASRVRGSIFNSGEFIPEISLSSPSSLISCVESTVVSGRGTPLTPSPLEKLTQLAVPVIMPHIIEVLDHDSWLSLRSVSKAWCSAVGHPTFPPVLYLPIELIQHILSLATPGDFDAARKTCRAWYQASLDTKLLRQHLGTMGFCQTDPLVKDCMDPFYLSRRLARECSIGSNGSGECKLPTAAVVDLSELTSRATTQFTVSICGSYVMLSDGCVIHVYRLEPESDRLLAFVTTIVCPRRVLAVSMDTSNKRFSVAILLDGRMGLVHDIVKHESKSTYRNLCSEDDTPRSVAICPQRRCVAFGCQGGIELHWMDALTGQDLNRWFPLTAPSDYLYFLPPRRGIDSTKKLRLISSSVDPQEINPLVNRFGGSRGSLAY